MLNNSNFLHNSIPYITSILKVYLKKLFKTGLTLVFSKVSQCFKPNMFSLKKFYVLNKLNKYKNINN